MTDYRFTCDWFSLNIPFWETHLSHLKGRQGVAFLEVGSFEGRSSVWLLTHLLTAADAHLDCVDVFARDYQGRFDLAASDASLAEVDVFGNDYEQRFDHNIAATPGHEKVRKFKERSQDALRRLERGYYDAIYLDGSHQTAHVLEDTVLAFALLKPGGILIIDDYEWPNTVEPMLSPKRAIDAFMDSYQGFFTLLHKEYQVILRKH